MPPALAARHWSEGPALKRNGNVGQESAVVKINIFPAQAGIDRWR